MKMTRKLIPAFVMLIVSAIMLSTASYAWFASNRDVKAQDMTVKANVVTQFLQISNKETGGTWSTAASPLDTTVKPLDLVHAKIVDDTIEWYTATSKNEATGEKYGELQPIDTTDPDALNSYVLLNTFWVKMHENSNEDLTDLIVSDVEITAGAADNFAKALRVLVVNEDGDAEIWTNTSGDFARVGETVVFADIVNTTAQSISIYIYYDGEDSVANTNNAQGLGNITVSVSFSAT